MVTIQSRSQHRLHDSHTNSGIWNWRSALGQVFSDFSDLHVNRIFSRNDFRASNRIQENQRYN